MILNKEEYKYYLYCDAIALGRDSKKTKFFGDEIWKFERLLRKCEYFYNCKKDIISKIYYQYLKYKFHNLSIRLGFSIPLNVFGPGLSIAHYGTIIVNGKAKIGKNCRIHARTTIGASNGNKAAPNIGDNVYIGTGATLIGNIHIGNNVAIGANSFVNKSFNEDNITIAGIPAKKISNNNSFHSMNKLLKKNKLL